MTSTPYTEPTAEKALKFGVSFSLRNWESITIYAVGYSLLTALVIFVFLSTHPPSQMTSRLTQTGIASTQNPRTLPVWTEASRQWLKSAWPQLAFAVFFWTLGTIWLWCGQMGYLAKKMEDEKVGLSTYWRTANAIIVPCLAGMAVLFGCMAGLFGIPLISIPLVKVSKVFILVPLLGFLGLIPALLWFSVKAALLMPIVIIDASGPLAALSKSFRMTRGHFLDTAGIVFIPSILVQIVNIPMRYFYTAFGPVPLALYTIAQSVIMTMMTTSLLYFYVNLSKYSAGKAGV